MMQLSLKCAEIKGKNTSAFQNNKSLGYAIFVMTAKNVYPIDLLEKFNLPEESIIFYGIKSRQYVVK